MHIHCKKAEKECKYWLDPELFEVSEAYSYSMNSSDKRTVKKIIFEYFEVIEQEWMRIQEGKET